MQWANEQACPHCGEKITKILKNTEANRVQAQIERWGLLGDMMMGA